MKNYLNSFLMLLLVGGCSSTAIAPEMTKPLPPTPICADERQQILEDEGEFKKDGKYVPYLDSKGYLTAGHGHLIDDIEEKMFPLGAVVPDAVVEYWFRYDMIEAIEDTDHYLKGKEVPPQIYNVLVNMAFNLGYYNLMGFVSMRDAIEENDWERMAYEMENSNWYKDVGYRSSRLVERVRMFDIKGTQFCNRVSGYSQ